MDYVRRAVWGMMYADDACIVSQSPQGLAKMMEVIVEVCRAFRVNRVDEEDRDYVNAPIAYTADNGANRSSRAYLQTGAILHLPRGCRDRNPGYVRLNRQADPLMLDAHQAVLTGALRPTESRALPRDPNGKGRGNRSPSVWM